MIDYTSMEERLSGEYRQVFEKAELYSDMNGIHEKVKADKMMNLLDLLMTAEADGKPVADIIGTDVKKFCQDYFGDYDIYAKIRLIPEKLYSIALALGFILLMSILFSDEPLGNLVHMHSDILPFAAGILMGSILDILFKYLIGPLFLRTEKIPNVVYYVSVIVLFVISIAIIVILIGDEEMLLPIFPFIVADVIYIVGYLLVRSVFRYRENGSIRKPKLVDKEFEIHFTSFNGTDDNLSENLNQELQKVMVKRFQRINKRRRKRNQSAMSTQEFIQKIRKEDARIPLLLWSLGILYLLLAMGMVVEDIVSNGAGYETVVFVVVILAIYIPLFLIVRCSMIVTAKGRAKILNAWEDSGVIIKEKK